MEGRGKQKEVNAYFEFQRSLQAIAQFTILPFDKEAADGFLHLRRQFPRSGTMDLKIASICLARHATLLSRNLKDFAHVPGLLVENWLGTETDKYGNFASSPDKAPVYVLGHELPFQFQHWTSGSLKRGGETDFRVFMGNVGEGQGAFCAVDQEFLPASDYVVATVIYKTETGAEVREKFDLKDRC